MKLNLKILVIGLVLVALIASAVPAQASETTQKTNTNSKLSYTNANTYTTYCTTGATKTVDLIAGGGNLASAKKVGTVTVTSDKYYLYVTYKIVDTTPENNLDNWYITETHLQVSTSYYGIPTKNGNPVPGQFKYKSVNNYATEQTYKIPRNTLGYYSNNLYIASHAVVVYGGVNGLATSLPETAMISALTATSGAAAYFPDYWVFESGTLDGTYTGWCIDPSRTLEQAWTYDTKVYSSYETLPAGSVEMPQNLDSVNWLLNNYVAGDIASNGTAFTYGDIQKAIWTLLSSNPVGDDLGPWDQGHVNELVAAGLAHDGFVPVTGQKVGIVFVPVDANGNIVAQVTLVMIDAPAPESSETAWGAIKTCSSYGTKFPGKNWATYFTYKFY